MVNDADKLSFTINIMRLYIADYKDFKIEEYLSDIKSQPDGDIAAKVLHYKNPAVRQRAFVRELLVKKVLCREAKTDHLSFTKNEHGKPSFSPSLHGVEFNISHSGTLVILGVGKYPLGVDVEKTDRIKDYKKLLRFLYEKESEQISKAPDQRDEFCRIWTYKEAFSKKVGVGLPLYSKEFIPIDYEKGCVFYRDEKSIFYEVPYPGYHITVCADERDAPLEVTAVEETDLFDMIR